jgi:hypothetical protein
VTGGTRLQQQGLKSWIRCEGIEGRIAAQVQLEVPVIPG